MTRRGFIIAIASFIASIFRGVGKSMGALIESPDLAVCKKIHTQGEVVIETTCCPPNRKKIVDFVFETPSRIRVRPAVQHMTVEHIEKYKEATRRMKALDKDDPRSFAQQANVHYAYCDDAYSEMGLPQMPLEVHKSWLFFPFHRWYLYFHEKILRSLIEDDDFVLPFWNYDDPSSMTLPSIFDEINSPLYDQLRNQDLCGSTKLINFRSYRDDPQPQLTDTEIIQNNLRVMRLQMVTNSKTTQQFFGGKYIVDRPRPNHTPGSLEMFPHNIVHSWVGSKSTPKGEDMGSFHTAARDPIFYVHHTNIDRLWGVWKDINCKNKDPDELEFLEASFLFYDEKAQLTRVTIKDCLNTSALGYRYDNVPIPWLDLDKTCAPTFINRRGSNNLRKVIFPLVLKSMESITIRRRMNNRSEVEKESREEVAIIDDIELDYEESVMFDVYINPSDADIRTDMSNFCSSFMNVPNGGRSIIDVKTRFVVGLTDLLDGIQADNDEYIVITLVPRKGNIKIGGLFIDFLDRHNF